MADYFIPTLILLAGILTTLPYCEAQGEKCPKDVAALMKEIESKIPAIEKSLNEKKVDDACKKIETLENLLKNCKSANLEKALDLMRTKTQDTVRKMIFNYLYSARDRSDWVPGWRITLIYDKHPEIYKSETLKKFYEALTKKYGEKERQKEKEKKEKCTRETDEWVVDVQWWLYEIHPHGSLPDARNKADMFVTSLGDIRSRLGCANDNMNSIFEHIFWGSPNYVQEYIIQYLRTEVSNLQSGNFHTHESTHHPDVDVGVAVGSPDSGIGFSSPESGFEDFWGE